MGRAVRVASNFVVLVAGDTDLVLALDDGDTIRMTERNALNATEPPRD